MEKAIAIMAAGIGNRYGGFKQMDPVGPGGEFIIDYAVYDAIRAGFNKVVFIIRHDIEKEFKDSISKRIGESIETTYTYQVLEDLPEETVYNPERKKPWGTVQATLTCANVINSPFAVINADDFYGKETYVILSQYLDRMSSVSTNACMVGFTLDHTLSKYGGVTRGICQTKENDILDTIVETPGICHDKKQIYFEEPAGNKKTLNKDDLVSMNIWGFAPSIFEFFREEFTLFLRSHGKELKSEFVIPTAINSLIKKNKVSVKVLSTPSKWFGVTYPGDRKEVIARIQQLVRLGEYPSNLWQGVIMTSVEK